VTTEFDFKIKLFDSDGGMETEISLTGGQVSEILSIPFCHLNLDEVVTAGILAMADEAKYRKAEAEKMTAKQGVKSEAEMVARAARLASTY
jgi:hypothetical protein